jgi:hypothetical protein
MPDLIDGDERAADFVIVPDLAGLLFLKRDTVAAWHVLVEITVLLLTHLSRVRNPSFISSRRILTIYRGRTFGEVRSSCVESCAVWPFWASLWR